MIYKTRKIEKRLLCLAFAVLLLGAVLVGCLWQLRAAPASAQPETDAAERMPAVPILMYHSVCNNRRVHSEYRITPETLESDLVYLKEHGYTSIFVGDLVAYVYEGYALPDKPLIITLDDGYLNNYTEGLPLLEK